MRWAANAGQNKLEWIIQDVEQEERERRLADLGVAAVANGFPVCDPTAREGSVGECTSVTSPRASVRSVLPALPLLAILLGAAATLAGYSVWRTAQEGLARMQGDIANAVKLESLHAHGGGLAPATTALAQTTTALAQTTTEAAPDAPVLTEVPGQMSVTAVEFLDGAALATVFVTQTHWGGEVVAMPELRFYVQTAKGWQRSEPIASFWGPTETLDTAHLHFVFGRRDQAVVAAAAPDAEATYVLLHRATSVDLAPAGLLPIEIVPDTFPYTDQLGDGRLRLTSPSFYRVPVQERATVLNRLLRSVLVRQLTTAIAQRSPAKEQWQPLKQAFGSWLELTTTIGFAPNDEAAALRRLTLRLQRNSWRLADLQGDELRYDPAAQGMVVYTLSVEGERQRQQAAAAEQLIDYIASTYGIDALPRLLQGFAQYDDWQELAPAVIGVSAVELEEGWHAATTAGAPARTFH